jgi:hypothetical protein
MIFPLFDRLYNDQDIITISTKIDMTPREKDALVNTIEKLDEIGIEYVYVLIKMYQMTEQNTLENSEKNSEKNSLLIPYYKQVKKDIKVDLNDLPNKLRYMLQKFVDLHEKKEIEKKEMEEKMLHLTV